MLTIASRNVRKVIEIADALQGVPLHVRSMADAGIVGEAVEDGNTLEDNALLKARYVWDRVQGLVLSDDTGIFINALSGQPGVHTARYPVGNTTQEKTRFIVNALQDVPVGKRQATFTTVAAVIEPLGKTLLFTGSVQGVLLPEPRTEPIQGMPYSALFVPDGCAKSLAEMSVQEENEVSHRGKAFAKVREYLLNYYQKKV